MLITFLFLQMISNIFQQQAWVELIEEAIVYSDLLESEETIKVDFGSSNGFSVSEI